GFRMEDNIKFNPDDDLSSRLGYFSLSEREVNVVDIAQRDIKMSDDECQRSLFGKVVGDRIAGWFGVKRAMSQIWRLSKPMEVKELSPTFFQFIFQSREDKDRVAGGSNWSFENQYLILSEWARGINTNHPCFKEIKLWAQVTNLPLNWLSTEVGLKIGTVFEEVSNVVIANTGSHGSKFLRLLVTLNLDEPVPRIANIRLGEDVVSVGFKYEKLMSLCHYCGKIGHLDRTCQIRIQDIKSKQLREGQYGDWLRATEGLRWGGSTSGNRNSPPPNSPSTAEQGTSHRASTSQTGNSNQLIPAPESSQLPEEQIEEVADVIPSSRQLDSTQSFSSSNRAAKETRTLVISEPASKKILTMMDVKEQAITDKVTFSLCHGAVAKSLWAPLKTWKRMGTKSGRLQREQDTPIEIDSISGTKRTSSETDLLMSGKDSKIQKQGDILNKVSNSEKVGVASLEWHPTDQ
ncbi:Unknown protein, partial [Striga hermonthica]